MLKVIHIPLDERPCNYDFPNQIFCGNEFDIKRVPFEYMGLKKKPGQIDKINEYLLSESKDAYALVVAIDTLLYGGLVPSRLHMDSFDIILSRLSILRKIKEENPKIKLYAYNLVMRCPSYNDDEEPGYYEYYGERIHRKKAYEHKISLGIASKEEIEYVKNNDIPLEFLSDYENRRSINLKITCEVLKLVSMGVIDFIVIPQDDSAPYGYTTLDQLKVKEVVDELKINDKVLNYPGADEVSCVLFARMLNEYYEKTPNILVIYPSEECKNIIPCAEDRELYKSVKLQIKSSGCNYVETVEEADLVLAVNAPARNMIATQYREFSDTYGYKTGRDLEGFVDKVALFINNGKKVTVCDIGYCNGSDPAFVKLIDEKDLYMKLSGYASWNIPCNSLGTAISMGVRSLYNPNNAAFSDFLMHRYVEDIGYSCLARKELRDEYCSDGYTMYDGRKPKDHYEYLGYSIYDVKGQRDKCWCELTYKVLNKMLLELCPNLKGRYEILDLYFPWSRTYDIGLKVKYVNDQLTE